MNTVHPAGEKATACAFPSVPWPEQTIATAPDRRYSARYSRCAVSMVSSVMRTRMRSCSEAGA